ncbi:MAG: HNH endonuclease signature motif containing protein, partial [Bacteroidales bacterium]
MARNLGTDKNGNNFKVDTQLLVWKHIPPYDTVVNKKQDACGTTIELFKYGKQTSTGWEIDHIKPVAKGGNDNLENLQALQRENNRSKGDKYLTNPSEYCTGTKEAGFTYIPAAPRYRSKKKPKIGRKSSKAPKDKKPVSNEAPKTNQESFDERLKILP